MVDRIAKLSLREQLEKIPNDNEYRGNRYDDDLFHILHIWNDNGNSYDIVTSKYDKNISEMSNEEFIEKYLNSIRQHSMVCIEYVKRVKMSLLSDDERNKISQTTDQIISSVIDSLNIDVSTMTDRLKGYMSTFSDKNR